MAAALPHLSMEGFITNKSVIMLKLFEHFTASDKAQSNTYLNHIASLKYLLNEYRTSDELENAVVRTLTDMYIKYFEKVEVATTVTEDEKEIRIEVDIICIDYDKEEYRLSKSISEINSVLQVYNEIEEEMHS